MARKVKSTKRADLRFEEIKNYLTKEFGETTTERFVKKVFSFYDILGTFPQIGVVHNPKKGIYGYVLDKPVSVFYRFNDVEVVILNFFDNRSGPERKKH